MKTLPAWPFILSFLIHSVGMLPLSSRTESGNASKFQLIARLTQAPSIPKNIELETVTETAAQEPVRKPTPVYHQSVARKVEHVINWQEHVSNHLVSLERKHMLYPKDAIRDGIEGVVIVFIVLDDNGKVIAVRIDNSSGHDILDQAALRSMRIIKPLPHDAPREFSLPVGFRIRD